VAVSREMSGRGSSRGMSGCCVNMVGIIARMSLGRATVPAVPAAATEAAATAMFTIDGKTLCVRCAPHPESTNDNHL